MNTFEKRLKKLQTNLVEIAYEFVDRNKNEIDEIFIYSCTELTITSYEVFYNVNGKVTEISNLNDNLKQKVDISRSRNISLLMKGIEILKEFRSFFKENNMEIPTHMKMRYSPKTGKFESDLSYEYILAESENLTSRQVFKLWIDEIKGELN